MRRGDVAVRKAWAIDTTSKDRHGLIGTFWFAEDDPPHRAGLRLAMFETRAQAKAHLASVRRSFIHARVVRVTLEVRIT